MPVKQVVEHPNLPCSEEKVRLLPYLLMLSAVPVLWIALYVCNVPPYKRGELVDSDCYTRLLRVTDLYRTGRWYDPVDLRSNAPYGQTSHWTRPFDVLMLLGAAPIALVADFRSSLFWWGVVLSPILAFATIMALLWSTRPILGKKGSLSIGLIFLCQMTLLTCFRPGRPDHHSLLIFLFALSIGLTLRMILSPLNTRLCYMAGFVGALSMWISPESMVVVGMTLAALGLFWLWEDEDFLDKSLHYAVALFVATGVNLIIERGWHGLFAQEYDRLSIVHFSVFGFIMALWITFSVVNRRTQVLHKRINRFLSIPAGAAMLALAIFISFPKFYRGPFADMDPRLAQLWISKINEMQPLLSKSPSWATLVQLTGSIILCVPFFAYLLFRRRHRKEARGWVYIFLATAVFGALAIFQYIRWAYYAQAAVVIPMAGLMNTILDWRQDRMNRSLKIAKNVLITLAFTLGLPFLGVAAEIFMGGEIGPHDEISMIPLCKYLNEADIGSSQKLRILTHVDLGEEILYRTQHEVIGTVVTIRGRGLLDTYDIMTADTDEKALELIRKRGIDTILLCRTPAERDFFSKPEQVSTFYQRLRQGPIPHWLRKVKLPADLSSFLLFEVAKD